MRWGSIVNIAKKCLMVIVNCIPLVCSDFCLFSMQRTITESGSVQLCLLLHSLFQELCSLARLEAQSDPA